MAFLVGGANSAAADAAYDIDNSLRCNDGDSPNLSVAITSTSASWTVSAWVKRGDDFDSNNYIISWGTDGTDGTGIGFGSISAVQNRFFYYSEDSPDNILVSSTGVYRDPSAWYHCVIKCDSGTITLYINGESVGSGAGGNPLDSSTLYVGSWIGSNLYHDGYISEVYFSDGTAYSASTFGETDEDSGIWKPKDAKDDLTFGTNGFYLEFKQTGTNQDSSGIGADTSGNDNHLAVTNLAATDQSTDTPTNNFATLNPLDIGSEATLSEGNCKYTGGTTVGQGQLQICGGTFGVSKGKWYYEVKKISNAATVGIYAADHVGANIGYDSVYTSPWDNLMHGCYTYSGNAYGGSVNSAYGSAIDDDDIIGVALDLDNGAIYYSDNGTFMDSGDPTSGASKTGAAPNFSTSVDTWILPLIADGSSGAAGVYEFNLGGCPAFTVSSGNSDANGYGNFEYAVPSGYYAPCTKNLAEFG